MVAVRLALFLAFVGAVLADEGHSHHGGDDAAAAAPPAAVSTTAAMTTTTAMSIEGSTESAATPSGSHVTNSGSSGRELSVS